MKNTTFKDCSVVAVDFMDCDLTDALFANCDLYRSEFAGAKAIRTNFYTSYNYIIDPKKTAIKKANFSLSAVHGLLAKHDIVVV
jgi:uncharacterized protein YjbI with pentapeptide repeats